MRFLFAHQNFPGQYLHIIRHLVAQGEHEIVFISEPNANFIPGVRRVYYQAAPLPEGGHPALRHHGMAAQRAEAVAATAATLKGLGFTPDLVIGHHGWGELLNIGDVFPGVNLLGYFEYWYRAHGQDVGFDPEFPVDPSNRPRIRAMNIVNLLALALEQHGQTPTMWQRDAYPAWAQANIKLLPEGAALDVCAPDPAARAAPFSIGDFQVGPRDRLVTYVARNLEPYRGFHTMMRALPELLRRPDVRVVMIGGDDVSYGARLGTGTWREHFQRELAGRYDTGRVLLPGQIPYEQYVRMLQRSDAHIYLTYPFVASWSLREAMACGCAIVAADVEPVAEFIVPGRSGLLTPALDPSRLAETVLNLLDNPALSARLRAGARRQAERTLDLRQHIAAWEARIEELAPGYLGRPPASLRPRAANSARNRG